MRQPFSQQLRLDCKTVRNVKLNVHNRHEIVPILQALKHLHADPKLRDKVLALIAKDMHKHTRADCGRQGLSHWQIFVLAGVRHGCGLDYDQLQDLAENHRSLRHIMGVGDWDESTSFNWRRIQHNLSHLTPQTIETISQRLVVQAHELEPDAAKRVRADSFVVETDIHYPTESSLIGDGLRKTIQWCCLLAPRYDLQGWRQSQHLLRKTKKLSSHIDRISSKKGPGYQSRLKEEYRRLLRFSGNVLTKARELIEEVEPQAQDVTVLCQIAEIKGFVELTEQVRSTARRRVIHGQEVPNEEKLFSLFEPHTQLYKRGKAGAPIQFGRLTLVFEDAAGLIVHHHVLPRDAQDVDVAVEQTRQLQSRLGGRVEELSFDCGFHSPDNQTQLETLVKHVCLPKRGVHQKARQEAAATEKFRQSRQRHPGVESAVGALQRGNRLKRCYDRTEQGFVRYVALGVMGRNLHMLGKLLIAQEDETCAAAFSKRQHAA